MAWSFGDGFDLYAAAADAINGYWDSGLAFTIGTGRFSGSRAVQYTTSSAAFLTKSSGVNDPAHHVVVSFQQTAAFAGTANSGLYIVLLDGATAQCSIGFQQNGIIQLYSGSLGTVLATYNGAFAAANVWYGFEFEVVINNTTGSFTVRKNGNNVADFTATGLNTRGGTANNYANKLSLAQNYTPAVQQADDFFWQSGASTGTWLGELRCATMMPASDQSVTFTRSPVTIAQLLGVNNTSAAFNTNQARYTGFIATATGTIATITLPITVTGAANIKCAIYSSVSGVPAIVLGSATPVASPVGTATFTFGTPVSVTSGTQYFVAFVPDSGNPQYGANTVGSATAGFLNSVTYSTFPTNNPAGVSFNQGPPALTVQITPSPSANFSAVSEAQQDGLTSYVYDSNPGDQDFYGLTPLVPAGASVRAATTRAYMQKSDVGTRTAAVQLKSAGAGPPRTWDPATLTGLATLSNGNLSASAGFSNQGVRALDFQTAGKFYFEMKYDAIYSLGSNYVGIEIASGGVSNGAGTIALSGNTGDIWVNGSDTGTTLGARAANDIIGIAVDLNNRLIWFRVAPSGNWNGSGTANPATGVGGISFSAVASVGAPYYPYTYFTNGTNGTTANFGSTAFTGAVPSAFTSGWPSVASTTVAAPTLTLTPSNFQWAYRTDLVDPNTSAAWTPVGANAAQIGPKVVA